MVWDGVVIKLCHAGFSLTLPLQYFENPLYTHCRLMKLFHARLSLPSLVSELLEFHKDEYPQWLFYEDDVRRRNLSALNGDVLAHSSASLPRRSKIRNKSAYIDSILAQLHEFRDIVFEGFVRLPSIIADISLPVNCNRQRVPLSLVYLEAMFGKEVAVMLWKPTCIISARGSEVMVTLDWATVPRNELVQRLNDVSFEDVCNSIRHISLGEQQDVSMRSRRKACTGLVEHVLQRIEFLESVSLSELCDIYLAYSPHSRGDEIHSYGELVKLTLMCEYGSDIIGKLSNRRPSASEIGKIKRREDKTRQVAERKLEIARLETEWPTVVPKEVCSLELSGPLPRRDMLD